MSYSDSIGNTTFDALTVVDKAFRRCRLPAQAITAEMQSYAMESLRIWLMELANDRVPSWCIQRLVLPLYEGQPIVQLPKGTISALNVNYRTIQPVTGAVTTTATAYTVDFTTDTQVATFGLKWSGAAVPLTAQTSANGTTWTTVATVTPTAAAGETTWFDIVPAFARRYFRLTATAPILYSSVTLGNTPQEIPLGSTNKDTYVVQSNKIFPGRPTTYWFQRTLPDPIVNLWPAPFAAAEQAQLIVWRHREVMDTENLQQQVEIPNRWMQAAINNLAALVAAETPAVDAALMPVLEARAASSLMRAWDGDGDGSSTFIQPAIGGYSK